MNSTAARLVLTDSNHSFTTGNPYKIRLFYAARPDQYIQELMHPTCQTQPRYIVVQRPSTKINSVTKTDKASDSGPTRIRDPAPSGYRSPEPIVEKVITLRYRLRASVGATSLVRRSPAVSSKTAPEGLNLNPPTNVYNSAEGVATPREGTTIRCRLSP